jgi:hypothetical protein
MVFALFHPLHLGVALKEVDIGNFPIGEPLRLELVVLSPINRL